MPNTLAHMGVHGLMTRAVLRGADLKWIYLGCVIPDIPWIMQRLLRILLHHISPYDLRLYAMIQASLCFSLILCASFALLSTRLGRTLIILGAGALLHLLLDACQIKWANGVHLMAPFDWHLTKFGLFWPEDMPTHLLTGFGLVYVAVSWRPAISPSPDPAFRPAPKRVGMAVMLLALYAALPLICLDAPEAADNHFIKTLRDRQARPGKQVEFDRAAYIYAPSGSVLRIFTGETLPVDGISLKKSASVSVRGRFVSDKRLQVREYHVHHTGLRDMASYVGLALVAGLWTVAALMRNKRRPAGRASLSD